MGLSPCRSGRRMENLFFWCHLFVHTLIFVYNLLRPCVTAVAPKRSRSFCQKCWWLVTAKHACTLRLWLYMKWHGAWLCGIHRMHWDSSSFMWHQPWSLAPWPSFVCKVMYTTFVCVYCLKPNCSNQPYATQIGCVQSPWHLSLPGLCCEFQWWKHFQVLTSHAVYWLMTVVEALKAKCIHKLCRSCFLNLAYKLGFLDERWCEQAPWAVMDTAACCCPETDWQGEQIVYKELQRSAEEHKQSGPLFILGQAVSATWKKKKKKKKAVVCAGFVSFLVTNNSPDRTELWMMF